MALVYRGNMLSSYLIDRVAADLSFDTIRLQVARDFDGIELERPFYDKIVVDEADNITKRREELLKKIEETNPVSVVMESVERLRALSKSSDDPKDVSSALATLRGYVELMMQRLGKADRKEGKVLIQQNNYYVLEELERRKLISVPDSKALKEFIGVEVKEVESEPVDELGSDESG